MTLTRIEADQLVPGRGEPQRPAVVVIEGGTIIYAGDPATAPPTPGAEIVAVRTLMPGLWDCHIHLWGMAVADLEHLAVAQPQLGILRAADQARRVLEAGFTSVREVGGYGALLAQAVEEGTIDGPAIYGAGTVLSQTGGHGDIHSLPPRQVDELLERHFGAPGLCDGPDDCRRVVRRQLRLGVKVIKVCASGGVMSQVDHPIHQQFSEAELAAIVEEAARAERVVAAHCHGKPGIMAALRAGVHTIEHGTYLDEEAAEAMRAAGALLVPTRWVVENMLAKGPGLGMPDYAYQKLVAIAERHAAAMRTAVAAGVAIALGTDIFTDDGYGHNARELIHLVEAGMSPLAAIEAATANGPLTLGPQAPPSGVVAAGMDADLVAVDGDPLADVAVLTQPARITGVWKRGRRWR